MALHRIGEDSLFHGYFSTSLTPVLTIQSGDTVEFSIPDAAWNSRSSRYSGDEPIKVEKPNPELDRGNCLAGPVAISGAEPGDTLEIKIEELVVEEDGWTHSGGWNHPVHQRLETTDSPEAILFWKLDSIAGVGLNQLGHKVKLNPFLGVMGMPVNFEGILPTAPPRRTGGNLDCKELSVGTTLFLPIEVPGGLFSTGDGHAAQGDGEVCVTAIECPMRRAVLTFKLHKDLKIGVPRARTPNAWITLGVHEDLDEAVILALDEMLALMGEKFALDKKTALALASVVADVRVTQIVNGVKGAHVILRDDAIDTTSCP